MPCFSCIHFFQSRSRLASGTESTLSVPEPDDRSEEMPRSWRYPRAEDAPAQPSEMSRPIASTSAHERATGACERDEDSNGLALVHPR